MGGQESGLEDGDHGRGDEELAEADGADHVGRDESRITPAIDGLAGDFEGGGDLVWSDPGDRQLRGETRRPGR
jgi:hypothetical protein